MNATHCKTITCICLLLAAFAIIENVIVFLINEHLYNSPDITNVFSKITSWPWVGGANESLADVKITVVVKVFDNDTDIAGGRRERDFFPHNDSHQNLISGVQLHDHKPFPSSPLHPQDRGTEKVIPSPLTAVTNLHSKRKEIDNGTNVTGSKGGGAPSSRKNVYVHQNPNPGIQVDAHKRVLSYLKIVSTAETPPSFISDTDLFVKDYDIFDILKQWSNLSFSFLNKSTPILHLPTISFNATPTPYYCFRENMMKHWHVECKHLKSRDLSPWEQSGNHIMFTLRTTTSLHNSRLPLLFQTWMTSINRSNLFIVTDGHDEVLEHRAKEAGMHYVISVPGYERLCEKAGDEISLMFQPGHEHYEWFCHIDDDIYVNLQVLVDTLAKFPRDEPTYFGRSGTKYESPRRVLNGTKIGRTGQPYHFAVGGMYCLNRVMLEKAKEWIGGREAFGHSCKQTTEPEDVTVGFVVGVILGLELRRTQMIYTHGLELHGTVKPHTLRYQIAFAYGYGAIQWGRSPYNTILVPDHLFSQKEDPSQFLSLHCHYYSYLGWCIHKARQSTRQLHVPHKQQE